MNCDISNIPNVFVPNSKYIIKNYDMVHVYIFITCILLFQNIYRYFYQAFSIKRDGTFGDYLLFIYIQ